ncbi:MAG: hypothetical protein HY650_16620 [Acidobacteria bacterium]|nr:hypothetical protein [Acidobacteriota bacterium]
MPYKLSGKRINQLRTLSVLTLKRINQLRTLSVLTLGILFLSFPVATKSSVSSQSLWGQIWGPVGTVAIGWKFPDTEKGHVVYATKLPEGDIYVYNGSPGSWTKIGGPAKKFVTVGNILYALSPDGSGVYQYTGAPGQWTQVGGAAGEIYGGLAGLFATNPQTGDINAYNCGCGSSILPGWTKLGGPGKIFAVGAEYLYGLSPDGSVVWQFDFATMRWAAVGGAAASIYAGGNKLYATNPQSGDVLEYNHETGQWMKIGGPGKMFAVDQVTGDLYGLSPDASAVYKYTGTPNQWMNVGGAATSIYAGWPNLYATSPATLNLWRWDNSQAYAHSQTAWTKLPPITSNVTPAVSGHSDGRVYTVAVAFNGLMAYSSTVAPGSWDAWQTIGPAPSTGPTLTPAFYADPDTSPVLIRFGDVLYLFARGRDNNLYASFKAGNNDWASWKSGVTWQSLTSDGRVRGRFDVALTAPGDFGGNFDIHVLYASESNSVEYRRFDFFGNPVSATEKWSNGVEGTIGTDGANQVWMAIRTNGRQVLIEAKTRNGPAFTNPSQLGWALGSSGSVTSRLADGPQGAFFNISNVVYFAGAFHVAYAVKYLCDDVSGRYCHDLAHTRIRPGKPDDGYVRFITDYTPQGTEHPQAELIVYRNKLVMAYRDHQGWIRYAYWDSADPTTPWVGREIIAWASTQQRPGLGALNRRPFLSGNDYATSNFGDDLFAVVNDSRTNGLLWFINFSRGIFIPQIGEQFALYNSNSDGMNPVCRDQNDPFAPTLESNLSQDGRPFLTELGYNLWTLPHWLAGRTFKDATELGCQAGTNTSGRFDPPCDAVKYPVIIMSGGGIGICSGIWQTRQDDYKRIWEELGHATAGILGLSDNNSQAPTQTNASLSKIPLSALSQAFNLFGQRVRGDRSCTVGAASSGRCRGFTGIAGNYDVGTRQHSFIYTAYYYFSDGDQLRQWVQEDLQNGDMLLQDKYNWIKQNIFKGIEFRRDNEPLID